MKQARGTQGRKRIRATISNCYCGGGARVVAGRDENVLYIPSIRRIKARRLLIKYAANMDFRPRQPANPSRGGGRRRYCALLTPFEY